MRDRNSGCGWMAVLQIILGEARRGEHARRICFDAKAVAKATSAGTCREPWVVSHPDEFSAFHPRPTDSHTCGASLPMRAG
jgi:hypothetical protein